MAANSGIDWTDATWNCLAGCEAISPGCANCYAATMTRRLEAMGQADYTGLTTEKHFNGKVRCLPHKLEIPLKWRKPRLVFVNSMSDLFHEDVPDEFILLVFDVMRRCTWAGGQNCGRIGGDGHTFQVLTKRSRRMQAFMARLRWTGEALVLDKAVPGQLQAMLKQIWLGVSCEDQQRADERIPWLLKTPAAVRFVSAEPLLGPIDMRRWLTCTAEKPYYPARPAWVIDGCESGHGRREYHPAWSWSIQEQCKAAGVAYFRKQMIFNGKVSHDPAEWHADWRVREYPKCHSS